jgi:F0F1-type ATP synthase assembly protein I
MVYIKDPIKTNNKKVIKNIHDYHPDYIFLTESTSILPGYEIKEAWRRAYPNEPLPKFYRIDPRQVMKVMRASGKSGTFAKRYQERKKSIGLSRKYEDETPEYFESHKKQLEEFFKKRLKDPTARIFVYDYDWASGESPGSIVALLKDPEKYGLDPSIRRPNIKMNTGGEKVPAPQVTEELGINSSDLLPDSSFWEREAQSITYKKRNVYGSDFRRPRRSFKYGLPKISAYKKRGTELGEELHAELKQEAQKKKSLEQRLSAIIGIGGFLGSIFFLGSSVTGNAIGNLGKSSSSWLGIGLLVIGLIAGFFWLKNRN